MAGCAAYTTPAAPARELSAAEQNFDAVWRASLMTLRRYRFEVAQTSRRDAVIRTDRMTGQHFVEFWRRDAATARDLMEGSLQTIYRTAEVNVVPQTPAGTTYRPEVKVRVSRSDRRTLQVTNTAEAYDLFSLVGEGRLRVRYGEEEDKPAVVTDLGRDEGLESAIAADIEERAAELLKQE